MKNPHEEENSDMGGCFGRKLICREISARSSHGGPLKLDAWMSFPGEKSDEQSWGQQGRLFAFGYSATQVFSKWADTTENEGLMMKKVCAQGGSQLRTPSMVGVVHDDYAEKRNFFTKIGLMGE